MTREYYETRALARFEGRADAGEIHYTSGPIVSIGGRPTGTKSTLTPTGTAPDVALQGYVVRYNKAHAFKGGIDVFAPGCFDASLASRKRVGFWLDHKSGTEMASTDDNLELVSNSTGLAFRLLNPLQAMVEEVRSRRIAAMSAGYMPLKTEKRTIAGETVRVILEADLAEISLVKAGAVQDAFIDVIDLKKRGSLREDASSGWLLYDGAAVKFLRASRKLIDGTK